MGQYIDIVFDGPPSHEAGRFVEVEDEHGHSVSVGEWMEMPYNCHRCAQSGVGACDDAPHQSFWHLRIKQSNDVNDLAARIHEISTSKGFTPPSMENLPQKLLLSVSELVEAMEEHRKERGLVWYGEGNKPEGILPELADSIIRNLHMMHSLILEAGSPFGLNVSDVIVEKVNYNEGRPTMHGGNIY